MFGGKPCSSSGFISAASPCLARSKTRAAKASVSSSSCGASAMSSPDLTRSARDMGLRHGPSRPRGLAPRASRHGTLVARQLAKEIGWHGLSHRVALRQRRGAGRNHPRAGDRRDDRHDRRGLARPGRCRGPGRRRRLSRLVAHAADRARRCAFEDRRRDRGERASLRRAGKPQLRQAARSRRGGRDPRRSSIAFASSPGAARLPDRPGGGRVPARAHQHAAARRGRRRGRDRAVELPADDARLESRAGRSPPATRWS